MTISRLRPRASIFPRSGSFAACCGEGLLSDFPIRFPRPMTPTDIKLHQQSRVMEITFDNGQCFELSYEYLRVYSPSAEVRGHGPGQEVLQIGKKNVGISEIEAVGRYAVRPTFSDGHNTGIYSWDYLFMLGDRQEQLWQQYLDNMQQSGASRE